MSTNLVNKRSGYGLRETFIICWLSFWYLMTIGFTGLYVKTLLQNKSATPNVADVNLSSDKSVESPPIEQPKKEKDGLTIVPFGWVIVSVMVFGALGSVVTATIEFSRERERDSSHIPRNGEWYWFAPFKGMLMAGFCLLAMRAGLLSLGSPEGSESNIYNVNVYFFVAVAAGLFADAAYEKLWEITRTVFGSSRATPTAEPVSKVPVSKSQTGNHKIHVDQAKDESEREEAYRIRYEVLVGQEKWSLHSADDIKEQVEDEYDQYAYILLAHLDNETDISGTVRTVLWRNLDDNIKGTSFGSPRILEEMLSARHLSFPEKIDSENCSYTSRLVATSKARGRMGRYTPSADDLDYIEALPVRRHTIATALATEIYYYGLSAGIQVDWITCVKHEKNFYERLGYRTFATDLTNPDLQDDPDQATCDLMYLVLHDYQHLQEVRSPFCHYLKRDDRYSELVSELVAMFAPHQENS